MPARMIVVALAVVGSLATAPAATAAERHCGKGPFRDYYDVRARVATCQAARDVVKAWGTNGCAVFQRCRARRYSCIGRRSDRVIAGRKTFLLTCRTSTRTVRWWIAPSH
jgi:hypothetical protein